jgi:hypothetical protein
VQPFLRLRARLVRRLHDPVAGEASRGG